MDSSYQPIVQTSSPFALEASPIAVVNPQSFSSPSTLKPFPAAATMQPSPAAAIVNLATMEPSIASIISFSPPENWQI
jgi:hypothetical protein